jgi:hypothetical protein
MFGRLQGERGAAWIGVVTFAMSPPALWLP